MTDRHSILTSTLSKQCPQCGRASLFSGWNHLNKECPECGLQFIKDTVDYLFVLYFTTALITGVFVVLFLTMGFPDSWLSRSLVIIAASLTMWGTLPWRKALAVAIEFKMRSMQ